MPHLIFEATPAIHQAINFGQLATKIHQGLAASGQAKLADCKSRLYYADHFLAGNDPAAQFVVVRLLLTKPRPKTVQQAMGQIVHDATKDAIAGANIKSSWQCCVLVLDASQAPYLKTVSESCAAGDTKPPV